MEQFLESASYKKAVEIKKRTNEGKTFLYFNQFSFCLFKFWMKNAMLLPENSNYRPQVKK